MIKILLSMSFIGMLLSGMNYSGDPLTDDKLVAIFSKTHPDWLINDDGIQLLITLAESCDKAMQESASSACNILPYENIGNVPALIADSLDVLFELELTGTFDLSQVESKKKTRIVIKKLRQQWVFDYYYRGDISFTPQAYLIIRTPVMNQLVDRIELPLDDYSVYIENEEPLEEHDIEFVLSNANSEGINGRLETLMAEVAEDVGSEVGTILSGESLAKIKTTLETLKNK